MGQPPFTNEVLPVDEQIKVKLHTLVGEYLAKGLTNGEILEILQTEQELSEEDAQRILRAVYDSWTSVREGLDLQSADDSNWHQYLRMRLLQTAMADESTPSQRLALSILDSLATIQGISMSFAQPVPLSIELIEKEPEPKPEAKPKEVVES